MNSNSGMERLLERIDHYLVTYPGADHVNILEGELKDMELLLYTLKGKGAVGLFDVEIVPTANKKNALEDQLYSFQIDPERYAKFRAEFYRSIKASPASYDPKRMVISCRNEEIHIPPDTNLAALCGYMFSKEIGVPVSWDVIYREIEGVESHDPVKDRKKVYDAVIAANKKFKGVFADQALFKWAGKSVVRIL